MTNSRKTDGSRRLRRGGGAATALALSLGMAAHAQTPIVSYNFNDAGNANSTVSTGSYAASDAALTFYPTPGYVVGATNTPGNLHGAAGSGVSGAANDLAFDNSASTGMGSQATNGSGCALTTSSVSGLAGPLTSFTVTGWFKSNASTDFLNDSARLLDTGTGSQEIAILGTRGGEIQFLINGQKVYSNASYSQKNIWTFFAIAYDSVAGAATFYVGYRPQDSVPGVSSPVVTSVGTENSGGTGGAVGFSTNPGTAAFTGGLDIGNSVAAGAGNNRGFAGLMDDVSIYGTALTQPQLDLIRQANLAPGLTGTVAPQGVQSPNLAQPMVFTITPTGATASAGVGVTQQTVTLGATSGAFALSGVVPGTYTIGAKGAKWLRQDLTVSTTGATLPTLSFSLPGGDLDGNNGVDFNDFLILRNSFNASGPNLPADITCDGTVDFNDFLILRNNFNAQGAP